MVQINLLPWREQQREQEKKRFVISFFVSIVLSVLIISFVSSYVFSLMKNQTVRNQMLQRQILAMNNQLNEINRLEETRKMFISRMSIIQHLQSTRTLMVHLFDELINIMPSGVYLTQIERQNNVLSMTGYTSSNTDVSILMSNIENNSWLHAPVLNEIKKKNTRELVRNEFKLNFLLVSQVQPKIIW